MGKKLLETNLNRELDNLRALLSATHGLTSGLRLEEILEQTLKYAMSVTSAQASTIWLLDDAKKKLTPFVAIGGKAESLRDISIKLGEGIAGTVAKDLEPILVRNVISDDRFNSNIDQKTGFQTKSILCVCLKSGDEVIGSLQVLNKVGRQNFSKRDMDLLSAFASLSVGMIKNGKLHNDIQKLYTCTVKTLVATIDARDPYTAGHSERVSKFVSNISQSLNFNKDETELFERAALLHDIGKIGVDDSILRKKGKLSESEFNEIKRHPIIGNNIVKEIEPKRFSVEIIKGVRHHHERIDSLGYPDSLPGKKIPTMAKVIAVADTYDALTSDRSYRSSYLKNKAISILRECSGSQLDGEMVKRFIDTL